MRTHYKSNSNVWQGLLMALCIILSPLSQAQTAGDRFPSLAPMVEEAVPAVVNISTTRSARVPNQPGPFNDPALRRFFGDGGLVIPGPGSRAVRAAGSGVIVDADNGYIITNHHVVANAEQINVVLADDRQFRAQLIGSDSSTDVALLQIEADNLKALPFADVSRLRVGDYVVAIGNPFGIGQTVTSGIVSALGRAGLNAENYEDFIQTDAAINMGNSGGALVDLAGNLVGINTAIISGTGNNTGVGFAVPVDMVAAVMEHLKRDGEVRRGQLGIQIRDHNPVLEQTLQLGTSSGALVTSVVPESAAERAGIQVSDVIVAVNEREIDSGRELRNVIGLMRAGTEVQLRVYRDGSERSVRAVIGGGEHSLADAGNSVDQDGRQADDPFFMGAQLQTEGSTLVVAGVQPQSPAWIAGLRTGDVITAVNRIPVTSLREFNRQLDQGGSATALSVLRENRPLLIIIS